MTAEGCPKDGAQRWNDSTGGAGMERIRIQRPRLRRDRRWREVLPLDPRDPDVLRAKALGRSTRGSRR